MQINFLSDFSCDQGRKVLCGLFVHVEDCVTGTFSQLPSAVAANGNCPNRPKLGKSLRPNGMKNLQSVKCSKWHSKMGAFLQNRPQHTTVQCRGRVQQTRENPEVMEKAVSWKQLEYALRFGRVYMLWVLGMGWRARNHSGICISATD